MFQDVLARVTESFSGDRASDRVADLWAIDRWFDFAHFKRSASYSAEKMAEAGLDQVEVISFPADGRTAYGDWVAPLAWDVVGAELEIRSPQTLPLCSYQELPVSLAMWSAPTPPDGIEAEVVLLDDWDDVAGPIEAQAPDPRLRGKILFGSRPGPELKRLAAQHGALGVISQHHAAYGVGQPPRPDDKVSWINAWSDHPFGWPFTRADTPAFGFSLSARQGRELLDLLRSGQPVRAWARVDARHYDGSFDFVTGVIPGRRADQEVLVFAHLYEQGAQDNAGGCAVVLEAARCLSSLIKQGRLPQPLRSIRFVLSWEIYGLLAYATTRPDAMRRCIAGLNLDSLGVTPSLSNALLEVHPNPHAQASYTDTLIERIARQHLPRDTWRTAPFDTTDAVIADPTIGVPTPWLGEMVSSLWHSSLDTPEKIDPATLGREGSVAATYLFTVANAGTSDAAWLAGEVYRDWTATLGQVKADDRSDEPGDGRAAPGDKKARRLSYLRDRSRHALVSCAALDSTPETAQILADFDDATDCGGASDPVGAWRRFGLDACPHDHGRPVVRWTAAGVMAGCGARHRRRKPTLVRASLLALYWADGRRRLTEIQELTQHEFAALNVDLAEYFTFLAQYGYVERGDSSMAAHQEDSRTP